MVAIEDISSRLPVALFIVCASIAPIAFSDSLGTAMETVIENAADNTESQEQINQLDDETQRMFSEYRTVLEKNRRLEGYLIQLKMLLEDQNQEIARKEREIAGVKNFEREMLPMLNRMIMGLEKVIENDVPFLPDERAERVAKLNKMMVASDINVAEKFRRVIEAYQVESDYGNTMETYRGSISTSSDNKVVDFLRVGRNVFLYQSLDGNEHGVWDARTRQWQTLDGRYRTAIQEAIMIARKQAAPNLLILPVQAVPLSGEAP